MKKGFLMVAGLMLLISATTQAQSEKVVAKPAVVSTEKAGWHKIGETTASFKMDKDAIAVLGNDRFKAIKLKVTDASIHLMDLEVYYENGTKEDIQVRSELKAGSETRDIDLKGKEPAIKKVVMIYKTMPNSADEKAHVELYGLK